ncbi:carbohydrate ABC transporter permease [Mycoplasmatota bacterium]|nr:carbohydrate ABC transporter permease [Mycoplasmatota bacterium]
MAVKSVIKKRKRISFVILLIVCVLWMMPIVWGLATSLKSMSEISDHPIGLIPRNITFENYTSLFERADTPVLRWLFNSFIIATIHTGLYLVIASFAAYAFSVLKFKGRNIIFWLLIGTTMIPAVINLVPLLTMVIDLGWFNSWLALIVPGLGGVFGLFLMRQFFLDVPKDLIESARMDGLGTFGIYFKIILPLSKSAIIVAGLFAFIGNYNDYLWPQIIMAGSEPSRWTLPYGLSTILGTYNYDYGLSMSAAIVSIIPVIIVYFILQNHIIEGVSRTGIK